MHYLSQQNEISLSVLRTHVHTLHINTKKNSCGGQGGLVRNNLRQKTNMEETNEREKVNVPKTVAVEEVEAPTSKKSHPSGGDTISIPSKGVEDLILKEAVTTASNLSIPESLKTRSGGDLDAQEISTEMNDSQSDSKQNESDQVSLKNLSSNEQIEQKQCVLDNQESSKPATEAIGSELKSSVLGIENTDLVSDNSSPDELSSKIVSDIDEDSSTKSSKEHTLNVGATNTVMESIKDDSTINSELGESSVEKKIMTDTVKENECILQDIDSKAVGETSPKKHDSNTRKLPIKELKVVLKRVKHKSDDITDSAVQRSSEKVCSNTVPVEDTADCHKKSSGVEGATVPKPKKARVPDTNSKAVSKAKSDKHGDNTRHVEVKELKVVLKREKKADVLTDFTGEKMGSGNIAVEGTSDCPQKSSVHKLAADVSETERTSFAQQDRMEVKPDTVSADEASSNSNASKERDTRTVADSETIESKNLDILKEVVNQLECNLAYQPNNQNIPNKESELEQIPNLPMTADNPLESSIKDEQSNQNMSNNTSAESDVTLDLHKGIGEELGNCTADELSNNHLSTITSKESDKSSFHMQDDIQSSKNLEKTDLCEEKNEKLENSEATDSRNQSILDCSSKVSDDEQSSQQSSHKEAESSMSIESEKLKQEEKDDQLDVTVIASSNNSKSSSNNAEQKIDPCEKEKELESSKANESKPDSSSKQSNKKQDHHKEQDTSRPNESNDKNLSDSSLSGSKQEETDNQMDACVIEEEKDELKSHDTSTRLPEGMEPEEERSATSKSGDKSLSDSSFNESRQKEQDNQLDASMVDDSNNSSTNSSSNNLEMERVEKSQSCVTNESINQNMPYTSSKTSDEKKDSHIDEDSHVESSVVDESSNTNLSKSPSKASKPIEEDKPTVASTVIESSNPNLIDEPSIIPEDKTFVKKYDDTKLESSMFDESKNLNVSNSSSKEPDQIDKDNQIDSSKVIELSKLNVIERPSSDIEQETDTKDEEDNTADSSMENGPNNQKSTSEESKQRCSPHVNKDSQLESSAVNDSSKSDLSKNSSTESKQMEEGTQIECSKTIELHVIEGPSSDSEQKTSIQKEEDSNVISSVANESNNQNISSREAEQSHDSHTGEHSRLESSVVRVSSKDNLNMRSSQKSEQFLGDSPKELPKGIEVNETNVTEESSSDSEHKTHIKKEDKAENSEANESDNQKSSFKESELKRDSYRDKDSQPDSSSKRAERSQSSEESENILQDIDSKAASGSRLEKHDISARHLPLKELKVVLERIKRKSDDRTDSTEQSCSEKTDSDNVPVEERAVCPQKSSDGEVTTEPEAKKARLRDIDKNTSKNSEFEHKQDCDQEKQNRTESSTGNETLEDIILNDIDCFIITSDDSNDTSQQQQTSVAKASTAKPPDTISERKDNAEEEQVQIVKNVPETKTDNPPAGDVIIIDCDEEKVLINDLEEVLMEINSGEEDNGTSEASTSLDQRSKISTTKRSTQPQGQGSKTSTTNQSSQSQGQGSKTSMTNQSSQSQGQGSKTSATSSSKIQPELLAFFNSLWEPKAKNTSKQGQKEASVAVKERETLSAADPSQKPVTQESKPQSNEATVSTAAKNEKSAEKKDNAVRGQVQIEKKVPDTIDCDQEKTMLSDLEEVLMEISSGEEDDNTSEARTSLDQRSKSSSTNPSTQTQESKSSDTSLSKIRPELLAFYNSLWGPKPGEQKSNTEVDKTGAEDPSPKKSRNQRRAEEFRARKEREALSADTSQKSVNQESNTDIDKKVAEDPSPKKTRNQRRAENFRARKEREALSADPSQKSVDQEAKPAITPKQNKATVSTITKPAGTPQPNMATVSTITKPAVTPQPNTATVSAVSPYTRGPKKREALRAALRAAKEAAMSLPTAPASKRTEDDSFPIRRQAATTRVLEAAWKAALDKSASGPKLEQASLDAQPTAEELARLGLPTGFGRQRPEDTASAKKSEQSKQGDLRINEIATTTMAEMAARGLPTEFISGRPDAISKPKPVDLKTSSYPTVDQSRNKKEARIPQGKLRKPSATASSMAENAIAGSAWASSFVPAKLTATKLNESSTTSDSKQSSVARSDPSKRENTASATRRRSSFSRSDSTKKGSTDTHREEKSSRMDDRRSPLARHDSKKRRSPLRRSPLIQSPWSRSDSKKRETTKSSRADRGSRFDSRRSPVLSSDSNKKDSAASGPQRGLGLPDLLDEIRSPGSRSSSDKRDKRKSKSDVRRSPVARSDLSKREDRTSSTHRGRGSDLLDTRRSPASRSESKKKDNTKRSPAPKCDSKRRKSTERRSPGLRSDSKKREDTTSSLHELWMSKQDARPSSIDPNKRESLASASHGVKVSDLLESRRSSISRFDSAKSETTVSAPHELWKSKQDARPSPVAPDQKNLLDNIRRTNKNVLQIMAGTKRNPAEISETWFKYSESYSPAVYAEKSHLPTPIGHFFNTNRFEMPVTTPGSPATHHTASYPPTIGAELSSVTRPSEYFSNTDRWAMPGSSQQSVVTQSTQSTCWQPPDHGDLISHPALPFIGSEPLQISDTLAKCNEFRKNLHNLADLDLPKDINDIELDYYKSPAMSSVPSPSLFPMMTNSGQVQAQTTKEAVSATTSQQNKKGVFPINIKLGWNSAQRNERAAPVATSGPKPIPHAAAASNPEKQSSKRSGQFPSGSSEYPHIQIPTVSQEPDVIDLTDQPSENMRSETWRRVVEVPSPPPPPRITLPIEEPPRKPPDLILAGKRSTRSRSPEDRYKQFKYDSPDRRGPLRRSPTPERWRDRSRRSPASEMRTGGRSISPATRRGTSPDKRREKSPSSPERQPKKLRFEAPPRAATSKDAREDLQVVIRSNRPSGEVLPEEAERIKAYIVEQSIKAMQGPKGGPRGPPLRFTNSKRCDEGWFLITPLDEVARNWLLNVLAPLRIGSLVFKSIKAAEAPWATIVKMFVTTRELDVQRLLLLLELQNPTLRMRDWKHMCTSGGPGEWVVTFSVVQEIVDGLEECDWTLWYELDSIKVRKVAEHRKIGGSS